MAYIFLAIMAFVVLFVIPRLPVKNDEEIIDDITSANYSDEDNYDEDYDLDIPSDLVEVPNSDVLLYSLTTRYVFYTYVEDGLEYVEPLTNDGHLCKFINNKLMEEVNGTNVIIFKKL